MNALSGVLLALAITPLAQAGDQARIDVSGSLIAPPCTPRFAASQQVELAEANLNQLHDDSVAASDVPLIFDCAVGSRVAITFSAGLGSADSYTLLTSRPSLGLQMSLLNNSAKADFRLGEMGTWWVKGEPLELTLRVRPVSLGGMPEAGSYNTTLLMQISYR